MIIVSIIISVVIFVVFAGLQIRYFRDTWNSKVIFRDFFEKEKEYSSRVCEENGQEYPQIDFVGKGDSDLNELIKEINVYLYKTKGTSDYQFIQNKVERKVSLRYDQASVYQSFPTYLGLMGTFSGVFLGVIMFLFGSKEAFGDDSIRNLLIGVLVSMLTSLVGLILTTINNSEAGKARKKVEDDKNDFFDFIQTDVTKTASASLVSAISKLHDTVDTFQPAFTVVIDGFKSAFAEVTHAFGEDFKQNVSAVTSAVNTMGQNMDKINANISLQEKLLDTFKSKELITGMEKYVEAANHFVGITQSLNKFEEARRMMLAAAQEAISIQDQYSESLKIPREIVVRLNQILDRIKNFEDSVNKAGVALQRRDILGNDVIDAIDAQVKGIAKKGKIADRFLEIADTKLEELYKEQTKAIAEMNRRYRVAIEGHAQGFEQMIAEQTDELVKWHNELLAALHAKFNIEDIRSEFSNLKKLNDIIEQLRLMSKDPVKTGDLTNIGKKLDNIQGELKKLDESQRRGGGLFNFGRRQNDGQ